MITFFSMCLWIVIDRTTHPSLTQENEQDRSGAYEALDFWSRARAYPDNDIPPEKYYQGYQHARTHLKELRRGTEAITPWKSIGPYNLTGRTISVAIDPANSNTIYAGSASGGLWRSYTGGLGKDWQRIETGFPVLGVGAIAISPSDHNTIFIGTGEVYRYKGSLGGLIVRTTRGSYSVGILKTTNGGLTWTKSLDWTYQQQRGVQAIRFNPLNSQTLYAATTEGVYKTTNGGTTWTLILFARMAEDIVINPLDTTLLIATTGNFGFFSGVNRSTDAGANWISTSDIPSFSGKALLGMYSANPYLVYASVADSTTGVGAIWKSTNFGLNWTIINSNPGDLGVQGWYSHYIAPHPTDSNIIFHGSVGAIKSTDGGMTWNAPISGSLYSDNHAFAVDPDNPNILYSANDDGIDRSTNFGSTFARADSGLQTGQLYNGFSNSTTDSLLAMVQSQDHIPGYIYRGSIIWQRGAADEAGWTAINPSKDSIMYAISRNGGSLYKSTNRGNSFQFSSSFSTFGAWNSPFVLASSNPNTIYVGKTRVFKSTDAGGSFITTNAGVNLDGNPVLSMAISSTSSDTVLVGTGPYVVRAHIFTTTNGGSTWSDVTGILPDRYPLDVAMDPSNSQVMYVAFGGFGTGHLYKSTNTGSSWTNITGSLPDVPTTAILVDPLNSNYVYVGNDIGVYVSTDGGTSWSSFSEGLPEAVLVSDLSYTPSNRTLRVGTHGNGAFERKLDTALPTMTLVSPNGGELWEPNTQHDILWGSGLVSAVKIEISTDNGSTWSTIVGSVPADQESFTWTVSPPLTSTARIRVSSVDNPSINDQSDGAFTILHNGITVPLVIAWNLVSLPVTASDPRKTTIFPNAISRAYAYQGVYAPKESLDIGMGYWLKFDDNQFAFFNGGAVSSETVNVNAGWNLIGSIATSIPTTAVTTIPSNIIISKFYSFNGSYQFSDSVLPGKGFWVKTDSSGQLVLSSSPSQSINPKESDDELETFGYLTFTDAQHRTQTLYFSVQHQVTRLDNYELPPMPPNGAFDIRFSSGRIAETILKPQDRIFPILLSGIRYPLTIHWNNDELLTQLVIDGSAYPMMDSNTITIDQQISSIKLRVTSPERPEQFALEQNYPNPFNPSTVIRYDLPEGGKVTLKIFNTLGEEVATLVDEIQDAGFKSVSWDGGNFPTGIYVYRLSAGSYTQSRKMVLIK